MKQIKTSQPKIHKVKMDSQFVDRIHALYPKVRFYETNRTNEFFLSDYSLRNLRKRRKKNYHVLRSFKGKQIPVEISFPSQSMFYAPPNEEAIQEVMTMAMARRKGRKKTQVLYWGRQDYANTNSFILDRPGGTRRYQWEIPSNPKKTKDIRKLFPRITRRIKDPDTKVILSLGSGGIRLFAHPSLMKFFDLLNLRSQIDEIWGCSGGAIAGLPYAMGVPPELIEEEGYHLYNERYSFRLSPSKFQVAKNLITDVILPSSKEMVKGFMDCQTSIRALLEKYFKTRKIDIPFYCIAYNLKKHRNEVLTPERMPSNSYDFPVLQTNALDAVIASSSIPILYVPKVILRGGSRHQYVDGATTEEVPLISPYRKWARDSQTGVEKRKKLLLISVNLFPRVSDNKLFTTYLFQKIPLLRLVQLSARFADLIRQARIDDHKAPLLRDPQVTHWDLNLPLSGSGVVNTRYIPEIIETAKRSFFTQLTDIEKSLSGSRR